MKSRLLQINQSTNETTNVPGKICVNGGEENKLINFDSQRGIAPKFLAATSGYLVSRKLYPKSSPYLVFSIDLSKQINVIDGLHDWLDLPIEISENKILFDEFLSKYALFASVDVATGESKSLVGFPTAVDDFPTFIMNNKTVYFGYGQDLLVIDTESNQLKKYIKDFIPNGYKDNGYGRDMNGIYRLMIDDDQLIALTFYGYNSRIVPLADLNSELR